MLILDVVNTFNKNKVAYAIVGGYAVALHGAVRGTVDLDLLITLDLKQMAAAEAALFALGFESRLPITAEEVFLYRDEYIKNRNLITWSFYKPGAPLDIVDILITKSVNDIHVVEIKALGTKLKVASIQSLIELKQNAGRPQDIEDVKALQEIMQRKKK